MKKIKASEFETKCLQLIDQVARTGETLVITKNGLEVAQLGPTVSKPASLAGLHKGAISIKGDIIAPVGKGWEAGR